MKFTQPDFSLESEGSINDNDRCESCEQTFPCAEITVAYSGSYTGGSKLLCAECAKRG